MKVALFGKVYANDQKYYLSLLIDELTKRKADLFIFEPFLRSIADEVTLPENTILFRSNAEIKNKVDLMVSVGGDGTLLNAVPLIRNSGIPILGINLGRLGFLSSVSKDEISYAVDSIFAGNYSIEKRALLQVTRPKKLFGEINYGLNDLAIYRNNSAALITIHVYVDEIFLNTYWGDGLIISTPTGSKAYSMSVGGPIVTPGSKNFIIAPIASHNLTVRPIILQDSCVIKLIIEGREDNYLATLDSQQATINREDEITIKRGSFTVNLVQMDNKNFFSTIREKLHWGIDIRN